MNIEITPELLKMPPEAIGAAIRIHAARLPPEYMSDETKAGLANMSMYRWRLNRRDVEKCLSIIEGAHINA